MRMTKKAVLIAILYLSLPLPVLAANIDLTFAVEGKVDRGEVVLKLSDRVKLFYEEERDRENRTIETVKGITFSFNFDLKKGE